MPVTVRKPRETIYTSKVRAGHCWTPLSCNGGNGQGIRVLLRVTHIPLSTATILDLECVPESANHFPKVRYPFQSSAHYNAKYFPTFNRKSKLLGQQLLTYTKWVVIRLCAIVFTEGLPGAPLQTP